MRTERRLRITHARRRIENGRKTLAHVNPLVFFADQHGQGRHSEQHFLLTFAGSDGGRCRIVPASNGIRQVSGLGGGSHFRGLELRRGISERCLDVHCGYCHRIRRGRHPFVPLGQLRDSTSVDIAIRSLSPPPDGFLFRGGRGGHRRWYALAAVRLSPELKSGQLRPL